MPAVMPPTLRSMLVKPVPALALAVAVVAVCAAVVHAVRTINGSHQVAIGLASSLPRVFELFLFAGGLVMLAVAFPRREGLSWHCARCGYQRVEEIHKLLPNCPECGHRWRLFGGWRVGRPQGSRTGVRVALVLLAAAGAAMILREQAGAWFVSKLSTPMLIRHAVNAPPDQAGDSWEELERRTLSTNQREWIAASLLDRRLRSGVLDRRSEAWLNTSIGNGQVPSATASRYFEELCDFWLEVPVSVTVGDAIAAEIHGSYRGPAGDTPLGPVSVAVESIDIVTPGTQATPAEMAELALTRRSESTLSPLTLHTRSNVGRASTQTLSPGTASVRAVVWVMVDVTPRSTVVWRPDGPLTVETPKKLIRRELVATVAVKPVPPG